MKILVNYSTNKVEWVENDVKILKSYETKPKKVVTLKEENLSKKITQKPVKVIPLPEPIVVERTEEKAPKKEIKVTQKNRKKR